VPDGLIIAIVIAVKAGIRQAMVSRRIPAVAAMTEVGQAELIWRCAEQALP
jgi:hypothetical protein